MVQFAPVVYQSYPTAMYPSRIIYSDPFYVNKAWPAKIPGVADIFTPIYYGSVPDRNILFENETCFAIPSREPTGNNYGHCLIMPKRQVSGFFNLTPKEILDSYDLIQKCRTLVENYYHKPGLPFKIETYIGGSQSIPHAHLHLIPQINKQV